MPQKTHSPDPMTILLVFYAALGVGVTPFQTEIHDQLMKGPIVGWSIFIVVILGPLAIAFVFYRRWQLTWRLLFPATLAVLVIGLGISVVLTCPRRLVFPFYAVAIGLAFIGVWHYFADLHRSETLRRVSVTELFQLAGLISAIIASVIGWLTAPRCFVLTVRTVEIIDGQHANVKAPGRVTITINGFPKRTVGLNDGQSVFKGVPQEAFGRQITIIPEVEGYHLVGCKKAEQGIVPQEEVIELVLEGEPKQFSLVAQAVDDRGMLINSPGRITIPELPGHRPEFLHNGEAVFRNVSRETICKSLTFVVEATGYRQSTHEVIVGQAALVKLLLEPLVVRPVPLPASFSMVVRISPRVTGAVRLIVEGHDYPGLIGAQGDAVLTGVPRRYIGTRATIISRVTGYRRDPVAVTVSADVVNLPLVQSKPVVRATGNVPIWAIGTTSTLRFEVSGGNEPYSWSVGQPTSGMNLNPEGRNQTSASLVFTPSMGGSSRVSIKACDDDGVCSEPLSLDLNVVVVGPEIVCPNLQIVPLAAPVPTPVSAVRGALPYTFLSDGTWPNGVTISSQSGLIRIAADAPTGSHSLRATVHDSNNMTASCVATFDVRLTVEKPLPGADPLLENVASQCLSNLPYALVTDAESPNVHLLCPDCNFNQNNAHVELRLARGKAPNDLLFRMEVNKQQGDDFLWKFLNPVKSAAEACREIRSHRSLIFTTFGLIGATR